MPKKEKKEKDGGSPTVGPRRSLESASGQDPNFKKLGKNSEKDKDSPEGSGGRKKVYDSSAPLPIRTGKNSSASPPSNSRTLPVKEANRRRTTSSSPPEVRRSPGLMTLVQRPTSPTITQQQKKPPGAFSEST